MKLWVRTLSDKVHVIDELQEIDVEGDKPTLEQVYQALNIPSGERCAWRCEYNTAWVEPDPTLPFDVVRRRLVGDGYAPRTALTVWAPYTDDASSDDSASTSADETNTMADRVWLAPYGDLSQTFAWPLTDGNLKVNGAGGLASRFGPWTTAVVIEGVELEPDDVAGQAPFDIDEFGGLGREQDVPLRVWSKGPFVKFLRKLSDWFLPSYIPSVDKVK